MMIDSYDWPGDHAAVLCCGRTRSCLGGNRTEKRDVVSADLLGQRVILSL